MRVNENPEAAHEIIQLAEEHRSKEFPRDNTRLHVSDLIYCRRKSWYRRRVRAAGGGDEVYDDDTLTMFLLGAGHHAVLQRCIPEEPVIMLLPGGIEVVGTPDMNLPDRPDDPGEIKTTRYSANKDIVNEASHYIEQLASYMLARERTFGRLYILFINGGYGRGAGGMRPRLVAIDIELSPGELREWREELGHRAFEVLGPNPPAGGRTHYKWECGYCPFNARVGGPCSAIMGTAEPFFLQDNPPAWIEHTGDY